MNAIAIQNRPDQYIISIDKKGVSQEFMLELLERLQVEQLAQKVDFDESILSLGEEMPIGGNRISTVLLRNSHLNCYAPDQLWTRDEELKTGLRSRGFDRFINELTI